MLPCSRFNPLSLLSDSGGVPIATPIHVNRLGFPGTVPGFGFCPGSKGNGENIPGFLMHFVHLHGM